MLILLRTCVLFLILLPETSDLWAARVFVGLQGGPPPYPGPPTLDEVVDTLSSAEDDPRLDKLRADILSLFHPTGERVSRPSVADADYVVFGWSAHGDLLLVAEDGTASLQRGIGWQNGWFDFAMMAATPGLRSLNPVGRLNEDLYGFSLFWRIRLTNETNQVATLYDFADRPLAVVKPGEVVERFLIDRINPGLLGHAVVHKVTWAADYSVGFASGVRLPLDPPGGLRARGVEYSREVTRGGVTLRFAPEASTGGYIATLTPQKHGAPIRVLLGGVGGLAVVSLTIRWLVKSLRGRRVQG